MAAVWHRQQRGRWQGGHGGQRGFTLVELVMVILIVGALAAVAMPKFIALGSDARAQKVAALAGTLQQAASFVHMECALQPACSGKAGFAYANVYGRSWLLNNGYPEAGDVIGGDQIDMMITHAGFTVTLPNNLTTRFTVADAATPTNCQVSYVQAAAAGADPTVTADTSGC